MNNKHRRKAFKRIIFAFTAVILLFLCSQIIINRYPQFTPYSVNVSTYEGEKITVCHLSDLHQAYSGNDREFIDKILSFSPDIIFHTGDLVSSNDKSTSKGISLLSELSKHCTVVAISGNHEHRGGLHTQVKNSLKEQGVIYLENEIYYTKINNTPLAILGADEASSGYISTPKSLIEDLESFNGIRILLCHYPENFDYYKGLDFDIQLSGHAHGGQIILPVVGGLFSPGQGFFPEYTNGMYSFDGYTPTLIVSRGIGNHVPIPRIFNRPHIPIIKIS